MEKLRLWRKERGLTLAELAERLETTEPTLSRWENGRRRPDIDAIALIEAVTEGQVSFRDWVTAPAPDEAA